MPLASPPIQIPGINACGSRRSSWGTGGSASFGGSVSVKPLNSHSVKIWFLRPFLGFKRIRLLETVLNPGHSKAAACVSSAQGAGIDEVEVVAE